MAGKIVGLRPGGKFRSGVYFVQFPDGSLSTKDQLRRIIAGQDAIPVRSRVHFDFDPVDEDGHEVPPGDPRLVGFYVDAFLNDENLGDLNQTGDEPDHGCTPVLKCRAEGSAVVRAYAMVDGAKAGDEIHTPAIRIA